MQRSLWARVSTSHSVSRKFRDKPLNFLYYLNNSLVKISMVTKERVTHLDENLYHHGLVKIILMEVLQKNKSWEDFLAENYFMECPVDSIDVCRICEAEHSIDHCPSLPEIRGAYIVDQGVVKALYAIAPKRLWKPHPTSMSQSHFQFFCAQNQMWNILMPWQPWPPQQP